MKKILLSLFLLIAAASPAFAANVNIDGLPAATSVIGANLWECEQGGVNNKCTATQNAAFIYGLMSGDATATGGGAVTFATVNANVGSFGSATACTAITVNAKGLITAASAATCTPAVGSVTGLGTGVGTALGVNVGSAGAFVTFNGALGTPSSGTGTNLTGIPISTGISGLGSGVAGAAANSLSAAGGLTTTIASGTAALGTSAVSSGVCGSTTTVAATNVATTDVIAVGFAADPTGTTGYLPTAMLTVVPFASSGNVNFKQCNLTGSSITPAALTINWRVTR